ncbi:MAG: hypothetical protein AB9869_31315 [Verrucomicrobiia bacterium]
MITRGFAQPRSPLFPDLGSDRGGSASQGFTRTNRGSGTRGGQPGAFLRLRPLNWWGIQVLFWLCVVVASGCATPRPDLRADLSAPGWRVREGQAVWRPAKAKPDLAGELLVASHPSGQSFVQFAKPPFQLVTAHQTGERWQITFGANNRTFSGRGKPPPRFIWLHLAARLDSGQRPPSGWRFQSEAAGQWRFENHATGETLEGYLKP